MKVLIDTCVIIDLLQKRQPFFEDAYTIFIAVANNKIDGNISAKSVTDIYYLMHHYFHDNGKTRDALSTLSKLVSIQDTTETDCKLALLSPLSDFEDAVMVETAVRTSMDCIVTRNIRGYSNAGINVFTPADFVEKVLSY